MRAASSIFALLILASTGCAHGPVLKRDPAGFDTRLLDVKYDRHKVSFLFLVSPKSAEASLDDRVVEDLHLMIEKVQDCQTHSPLKYSAWDYFLLDEIDKHLVKLSPGFWYGAPVEFDLFKEPGPDCVEITAQYRSIADVTFPMQPVQFQVSITPGPDSNSAAR